MSNSGTDLAVRDLLLDAAHRLGSATEARWMIEQALGNRRAIAEARTGAKATESEARVLNEMVERRLSGEPLQYVIGNWAFRYLELDVDPRVLIPRPETEVVVGHALDELARYCADAPNDEHVHVADIGTGSGAIALSLALEGPTRCSGRELTVWATDVDRSSLDLAESNSRKVVAEHPEIRPVTFGEGDWFGGLPRELQGELVLVVANPPYISEEEWKELDAVVRDYEPRRALVSGPTGTEAIDEILEAAPHWLAPNGSLVVEIAPGQAEDSSLRAIVSGFDAVVVRRDFAERSRALVARLF